VDERLDELLDARVFAHEELLCVFVAEDVDLLSEAYRDFYGVREALVADEVVEVQAHERLVQVDQRLFLQRLVFRLFALELEDLGFVRVREVEQPELVLACILV